MNYDVTIGIPFYRSVDTIVQTLESALSQTYESIEFLLIDDSGNDGIRVALQQFHSLFRIGVVFISVKITQSIRILQIGILMLQDFFEHGLIQRTGNFHAAVVSGRFFQCIAAVRISGKTGRRRLFQRVVVDMDLRRRQFKIPLFPEVNDLFLMIALIALAGILI